MIPCTRTRINIYQKNTLCCNIYITRTNDVYIIRVHTFILHFAHIINTLMTQLLFPHTPEPAHFLSPLLKTNPSLPNSNPLI